MPTFEVKFVCGKVVVPIREFLEDALDQRRKIKLPLALGINVSGETIVADLAVMPHLLVAGMIGSEISVCIDSIITSLLYRFAPYELRFIMIDPEGDGMQAYKDLPYLALPVVTDPKQALHAMRWVVNEMEKRYAMFADTGCRNIETFNACKKSGVHAPFEALDLKDQTTVSPEFPEPLPYLVVIVNELSCLMETAPADIELAICRIAQKARAAGIHLIIATQSPRCDVVTGLIKANFPCRIALQVSSAPESRVILDRTGAEKLVGTGDMLYLPPGTSHLVRAQGSMVSDDDLRLLVEHCSRQGMPIFEAMFYEATLDADIPFL